MNLPSQQQFDQMLDQARIEVFKRDDAAFLATILTSMDFHWIEPEGTIKTAATDGKNLYWNKEDFILCEKEEKRFTLIHEIWHPALLHFPRGIGRDHETWNDACDIVINNRMVRDGYKLPNNSRWLVDLSFGPEVSEEEVYDALIKERGKGKKRGHGDMVPLPGDSAKQAQLVREQIEVAIRAVQAAKAAGKEGSIPGCLEHFLDQFLNPVVNWRSTLAMFMNNLISDRYTWAKRNRRYPRIYMPSRISIPDGLEDLVFFMDTSASVEDPAIRRMNSELKYIWETLKPKRMTVVQFDTKIHDVRVFNEGDEFKDIKVYGRGGTSMVCVREWIEKHRPTGIIIMSDLECAPMVKPSYDVPILWAAIPGNNRIPNYGTVIHIRD